jgi:hypothetical protein
MGIAKFSSKEDMGYIKVLYAIEMPLEEHFLVEFEQASQGM